MNYNTYLFFSILIAAASAFIYAYTDHRRRQDALEAERIRKTDYYAILETIKSLHRGQLLAQQLEELSIRIEVFEECYDDYPDNDRLVNRMKSDLTLKENELLHYHKTPA